MARDGIQLVGAELKLRLGHSFLEHLRRSNGRLLGSCVVASDWEDLSNCRGHFHWTAVSLIVV
jgi:hypothetical protein